MRQRGEGTVFCDQARVAVAGTPRRCWACAWAGGGASRCRPWCMGGGGNGSMARAVMARERRCWRGGGGTAAARAHEAWGRGLCVGFMVARPAVASAVMARADKAMVVGMSAAGLATAATVPASMVAARQRWQGRRWRHWWWQERRGERSLVVPPRQPSPRYPSALGPGVILLVARSDLRHAIGVLSLRHLGGGAGTEREAECSKSGSTPRVGRLPLTDEGIHWVHADG